MDLSTGDVQRKPHEVSVMTSDRRTCRLDTPCRPQTLAEAMHCAAHHAELTLTQIVGRLAERDIHVKAKQVYDWTSCYQREERMAMPMRVAAGIVEITRSPIVAEFELRRIGYRVEPIGTASAGATRASQVQDEAMELVASVGVLMANVRAALADHAFDEADVLKLRAPLRDAKQRLAELERAIEARADVRVA